jgi:hypothetical protein
MISSAFARQTDRVQQTGDLESLGSTVAAAKARVSFCCCGTSKLVPCYEAKSSTRLGCVMSEIVGRTGDLENPSSLSSQLGASRGRTVAAAEARVSYCCYGTSKLVPCYEAKPSTRLRCVMGEIVRRTGDLGNPSYLSSQLGASRANRGRTVPGAEARVSFCCHGTSKLVPCYEASASIRGQTLDRIALRPE